MTSRAALSVEILEKLGLPLTTAASSVDTGEGGSESADAESVAALLGKSVQVGVSLSQSLNVQEAEGRADSLRLALTGIAGQLISGRYKVMRRVPGEDGVRRLVTAMEAVLAFADNFVPAAEMVERMQLLEPGESPVDEYQVNVQYLFCLAPVVDAISAFSFGQPETQLAQDASRRLISRSEALQKEITGGALAEGPAKRMELRILRTLAELYASCHHAEREKLSGLSDSARPQELSIDPVWEAFDRRAAMMTLLVQNVLPGNKGTTAAGGGAAQAPVSQASPPQETVPPVAAPQPPAEVPPAQATPPLPPQQPEQPVESPAVPPPAEQQPPVASEPPAEAPDPSNPMSFFKPGAKKDDSGGAAE